MGKNYDNWERLVGAVLLRGQFRELRLLSSPSSNSSPSSTSQFLDQSLTEGQGSELLEDHSKHKQMDRVELEALLHQLGGGEPVDEKELQLILSQVDKDGDGCVTFEELVAFSSTFRPPTCHTEMRDVFNFFDMDCDGKITAEELFHVFKKLDIQRR